MATIEGNRPTAAQSAEPQSSNDVLFDRQLPHHVEAERAVLGSVLLLPEVFDEVGGGITISSEQWHDTIRTALRAALGATAHTKEGT